MKTIPTTHQSPNDRPNSGTSTFLRQVLFVLFCLLFAVYTQAQDPDCYADTISLNTGYNPNTAAVLSIGDPDPRWRVISDPDPGTAEPRPAWVINQYPGWAAPLPNSRWISSYPTASDDLNGDYDFQYCFCLEDGYSNPFINIDLRSDDQAFVYLNGNLLGNTPNPGFNTALPTHIESDDPTLFQVGRNCILVNNKNIGSVAMGYNLQGFVTVDGITLQTDACCNPGVILTGAKFNDLNGDGIWQGSEPGLEGWTITITDGINTYTAVTDALGNYYFFDIPAGTYTVAETNQPGWTQTAPPSGIYTVTVLDGEILTDLDFGNTDAPQPPCDEKSSDYFPAGEGDCCYYIAINNYMPDYFTGVQVQAMGGVSLTYSDVATGWTDNAFGTDFVQVIPDPFGYVPVGTESNLVKICLDDFTTAPQQVEIQWYGPEYDLVCADTLEFECGDCATIFDAEATCEDGVTSFEFYIDNPIGTGWDVTYYNINDVSGGSASPTSMSIPPIPPGTSAGPFTANLTGTALGNPYCFSVTVHNGDPATNPDLICCTSDTLCIDVPICDPCDDVSVYYQGDPDDCCYSISLVNNYYDPNFFYGIETEVITPGVFFSSVNNYLGSGWTVNPVSSTEVGWTPIPPNGSFVPTGVSSLPTICLGGYAPAPQLVEIRWLAVDGTICRDTVAFDCPMTDDPDDCAFITRDSISCGPAGDYLYDFSITNNSGHTLNSLGFHSFAPSGISISPNPVNLGTLLPYTSSVSNTVSISGPDAVPGATICFNFTVHEQDADGNSIYCCTPDEEHCIVLPDCEDKGCTSDDPCPAESDEIFPDSPINDAPYAIDDCYATLMNLGIGIPVLDNDFDYESTLNYCNITIVTPPSNGTVFTFGTTCTLNYRPDENYCGCDHFVYEICDEEGLCDLATVYINVECNGGPVIVNDTLIIGVPIDIDPLTNDYDTNGVLDINSLDIVSLPMNGIADLNGDGTIHYEPNAGFEGTDSFIYSVCNDASPPACGEATIFITVEKSSPLTVDLDIRLFLVAPYDQNTGLMKDNLRAAGYIPTSEPYTDLGYARGAAQGGETVSPNLLEENGARSAVDWILIELRDRLNPSVIVTTQAAMLLRDGSIVDTNGNSPVSINIEGLDIKDFAVAIRHRNHLSTIMDSCSCCDGACLLDFTTTSGLHGQVDLGNGIYGIQSGDASGNDVVNSADRSDIWNNRNFEGYHQTDINFDGVVNAADRALAWNNRNSYSDLP